MSDAPNPRTDARTNPVSEEMRARFPTLDRIWKNPQYEGKAVCSESFKMASELEAVAPLLERVTQSLRVFAENDVEHLYEPSCQCVLCLGRRKARAVLAEVDALREPQEDAR